MLNRKRNKYEDRHLKNPAFLEKYFQKKTAWVITVASISALMLWALSIALPDFLRIKDDPDFDLSYDLFIILGSLSTIYLAIDDYRFYQKEIWGKKDRHDL